MKTLEGKSLCSFEGIWEKRDGHDQANGKSPFHSEPHASQNQRQIEEHTVYGMVVFQLRQGKIVKAKDSADHGDNRCNF
jgi:hypothetical protein